MGEAAKVRGPIAAVKQSTAKPTAIRKRVCLHIADRYLGSAPEGRKLVAHDASRGAHGRGVAVKAPTTHAVGYWLTPLRGYGFCPFSRSSCSFRNCSSRDSRFCAGAAGA